MYPLAVVAQRFPKGRVCGIYIIVWGVVALLTCACSNYEGIMAQRFFLGFFEAGVSPAFFTIISTWYTKPEQAFRAPFLNSCQGFGGVIFCAIFYGCTFIGDKPTDSWRYIYYVIGSLTIAWGFVVLVFLPDSPVTARWLNQRDRFVAVERIRDNQAGLTNHMIKPRQILETVSDVKVLLLCAVVFAVSAPSVSICQT